MRKLTIVESVAAPLLEADIDTDVIFPARFLLRLNRKGLGDHLFDGRRKSAPTDAPFVLDQPTYKTAQILVAGDRFGVGSSREHAVWALEDFGIRVVIAPSFGDIFYANCFKNGVLPIRLDAADYDVVARAAQAATPIIVDLDAQQIRFDDHALTFDVAARQRRALLLGLDEIDAILSEDGDAIAAFETDQKEASPWLYLGRERLSEFIAAPPAPARKNESAQT